MFPEGLGFRVYVKIPNLVRTRPETRHKTGQTNQNTKPDVDQTVPQVQSQFAVSLSFYRHQEPVRCSCLSLYFESHSLKPKTAGGFKLIRSSDQTVPLGNFALQAFRVLKLQKLRFLENQFGNAVWSSRPLGIR